MKRFLKSHTFLHMGIQVPNKIKKNLGHAIMNASMFMF